MCEYNKLAITKILKICT